MKLKLKKEKIVVLTNEQQISINGGAGSPINNGGDELALTGSRLLVCGSRRKCGASGKSALCFDF